MISGVYCPDCGKMASDVLVLKHAPKCPRHTDIVDFVERDPLVEALEFYADETNYEIDRYGQRTGFGTVIDEDKGLRARVALREVS